MNNFKTEQEEFWAGQFGNDYIDRNKNISMVSGNIALYSDIFSYTDGVKSIIEFGANIGLNLLAIKQIMPHLTLSALEINDKAVKELEKIDNLKIYHQSLLNFIPDYKRDFVLVKATLIHIDPDELEKVYNILYETSNDYICLIEYYNPKPVEVNYRGHERKLFKRDFAGEMLDKFKDLHLIKYGFAYHRDVNFPQDDVTWFLLKKGGNNIEIL